MDWRNTRVALDGTHHTVDGRPIYDVRFREVLKYHAPGLAPALGVDGACHIDLQGQPAYANRFVRTFGFYDDRAAVQSASGWCHVMTDGRPAYSERHDWCGNFQSGWCTVRESGGHYHHIDREGAALSADRWAYAGDFRDGVAVVQAADGRSTHLDDEGELIHGRWFLDLDVFHKGFARARDERGWMHVDSAGKPVYERRFAAVEPFYNGQARVERGDGALEVIDERGARVVELRPPRVTALQRLSGQMVGFWQTQTIRAAVALGVFEALPGTAIDVGAACSISAVAAGRLLRGLWELEIVEREGDAWTPSDTGRLLCGPAGHGMRAAALHWSTEHYRAWESLPDALRTGRSAFRQQYGEELFSWLAARPAQMQRFQDAMLAYAEHDYRELHSYIDFAGVAHVIDAGGGSGVLLAGLLAARPELHGTLLDLPAVTSAVQQPAGLAERFRTVGADLTEPWACTGDLVVLARVLHDWADAPAASILRHARAALRPGGRVVLVEWVLSGASADGAMLDLNMAALCGSRERTLQDWRDLAGKAGLRVTDVKDLPTYGAVLELQP